MTKRLLTIFLIAGICQGQNVDLANRRIHHVIEQGRTTHTIGDLENKGVFEARCRWRFFRGERELELKIPGVQGSMRMRNGKPGLRWDSAGAELDFVQDGDLLRWHITLDQKPPFSWYSMQFVGWQQYQWDYQTPFPSPEEFVDPNDGLTYVRQYGLPDDPEPGMIHTRLKSIDGGYVVWTPDLQWGEYRTGNTLSVHRPKMTDADGKVFWSTITIVDGLYTVTFANNAWNSAKYPVLINDTFGETDESGFTYGSGLSDYVIGDNASPSSDGDGDSMHVYTRKWTGNPNIASAGVYLDQSPASLVSNAYTPASAGVGNTPSWVQLDFATAPSFSSSSAYLVAWHMNGGLGTYYNTTGASGRGTYEGNQTPSDGSMPTGFTWNIYNRRQAVYCTYTPSGGATAAQIW